MADASRSRSNANAGSARAAAGTDNQENADAITGGHSSTLEDLPGRRTRISARRQSPGAAP